MVGASGRYWRIEIGPRTPGLDAVGRDTLAAIHQAGLRHIVSVSSSKIYFFDACLLAGDVERIAVALLADPVVETCMCSSGLARGADATPAVEVHPLPGVMDPVAMSAAAAVRRWLGTHGRDGGDLAGVRTARRFGIVGARTSDELAWIAARVLANGCIETWYVQGLGVSDALPEVFPAPPVSGFRVRRIGMGAMSDGDLERVSREAHLFLSVEEMRAIQSHFRGIGRDPTDLELETVAQTWSEHCVHKTLKSEIEYCGEDFGRRGCVTVRFENLLKDTIVKATETLARDWCLSVFTDNAGVIALDDAYGIAFKAETHNHPSAIEPYGGAATGVGGCIRDIMGCGLGAKPIASTDVFCLAPPDFDAARLPKDVLHPRRVYRGVVRGVRDYGNRMGIPTVNGAVYFDERYIGNPLVFCGCVGLIPRDRIDKAPRPGDRIVVAGGRTGRDGIHGATFSSAELTDSHADEFSHAVQIGNAIEEKKLLDAMLLARDHAGGCLYSAVTDCGAGGLSSAVGEMAEHLGAVVDLEKVPLKYSGLRYDEIWISEAQERMVFAVPPEHVDAMLGVFAAEEVEATVIGRFGDDRVLRVRYDGAVVGELDMGFLHDGLPRRKRRATWTGRAVVLGSRGPLQRDADGDDATRREDAGLPGALGDAAAGGRAAVAGRPGGERLLRALARDNTASKEWVIRQYDHEVQGRSVVKPLVGPGDGPSDAAVLRPRLDGYRGIALGCGLCPHVGDVDPYLMAVAAVDEALRNVISVGADPARTAILDNFCWGACDTGSALGGLVRACKGASDAAIAYGLPFISGKDSLNNEFVQDARDARRVGLPARIVIPGTLLISALGIVRDVRRCVTMDLKRPGGCLVLASAPVDRVGLEAARSMHDRVAALIAGGRVLSCHDVSDGGLAVGIAEMCIASGLGARVAVDRAVFDDTLFAEAHTTYVLEMGEADAAACGLPVIGHVEAAPRLQIDGDLGDGVQERDAAQGMGPAAGMDRIDCAVRDLAAAWRSERLSA